jgi:hypothetical protein
MPGANASIAQFAAKAVKLGLSGRAGLAAYRAGGGAVANATWYRAVGTVRRTLADSLEEATRPLNRRPQGNEITQIPAAKGFGFRQQLSVMVQNKDTGEVEAHPFTVRGKGLLTRQAAIDYAVSEFEAGVTGSPDRFNERILGAVYENTLEFIPKE